MCITESPTPVVATANLHWYALRVFHHRTSEVMARLHDDGWRTYVAMRREENVDIHYNDSRVKDLAYFPAGSSRLRTFYLSLSCGPYAALLYAWYFCAGHHS